MNDVLRAQLRSKPGRMLATAIAVVVAVAFVVVTLSLGSALTATLKSAFAEVFKNADLQVTCSEESVDHADRSVSEDPGEEDTPCDHVLANIRALDDVAHAAPLVMGSVHLQSEDAQTGLQTFDAIDPELTWQELTEGRWPEADNEIALDVNSAELLGVGLSDQVQARLFGLSEAGEKVTIVGLYDAGDFALPTAVTPPGAQDWKMLAGTQQMQILVRSDTVSPAELKNTMLDPAITQHIGGDVTLTPLTVSEAVDETIEQFGGDTGILTAAATVFSLIAVVVAGIVITLTFQVLVIQRTRELALLRCIGASIRQIRRLVIVEALIVGMISSLIGALLGGATVRYAFPLLSLKPEWSTAFTPMIAAFFVGVILTVICAISPSRRATRVPPLAALRPVDLASARSQRGIIRAVIGLLIAGAGGAMLGIGLSDGRLTIAMPGGIILFVGAVILMTFIVPPLVRLFTAAWTRVSAPSELAAANVLRNPGRTAATAVALVVGIGLVTTVVVGKESVEKGLIGELDERRPVDVVVTAPAFTDDEIEEIRTMPGVSEARAVSSTEYVIGASADELNAMRASEGMRELDGAEQPGGAHQGDGAAEDIALSGGRLIAITPDAAALARIELDVPEPGTLFVSDPGVIGVKDGEPVDLAVRTEDGSYVDHTFTVRTQRGADDLDAWVNPVDLDGTGAQLDTIYVRLSDSVDSQGLNRLGVKIEGIADGAQVSGGAVERLTFMEILDVMMYVILGLLGAAIVISVIGVSNTLALSVAERTQESGLLRALGLRRGQMRLMLAFEALFIAVAAVILGLALGIFEAWAGVRALANDLELDLHLTIPVGWLVTIVAVAFGAALLASLLPARAAARTSPMEAMTAE
ncbi:MAG: FtsX-like permease family protein [Bowdeniella nasicola]|nr:FtsX-like permease family protein [Bowdeniella nasicola]